ncbi:MAG TPA: thioredoxin family protein [Alphaproteobacteria bacterium]|nr:thioredoxin family protein [Alphaproteobacteria bacterium]
MSEQHKPGHLTGTRADWLQARRELLEAEKDYTRRGDELARWRQELPWVRVDKPYAFDGEQGRLALADLFQGRSQLMVYHFMFGPDYKAGCPSCSAIADGFNGVVTHLAHHDVSLVAVSRAPLAKLLAYRARMGWSFPWVSSAPSDFNADFSVGFSEAQQQKGIDYNFRQEPPMRGTLAGQQGQTWESDPTAMMAASTGTDVPTYTRERPGVSSFVMEDGVVYHSYSAYARGVDGIWSMYPWLDRAPKGRNETGVWWRRHDEYGA